MIIMVVLGATLGALVFSILWALIPRRTSVPVQLARFYARPTPTAPPETGAALTGAPARLGAALARWSTWRSIASSSLRQDLALTGRALDAVLGLKAVAFVCGFFTVVTTVVIVRAGTGFPLPVASPALLAAGAGAALFFVPDVQVRREATHRRREFRRALGTWLDLVALEMAGSAAPAEALPSAARVATGWPMIVIRDSLYRASLSGQDHWGALSDLGHRIGVPELIDLAALARLVERDGARVRDTLTARAASLRRALLADLETRAGQRDQSMLIAQILIGFGFVVFLMYPAVVNVMTW
jgi:tight adherence protein C